MYALARYATRRPVAVTVLAAAVVVLGWISGNGLPLDLLPDLQSPTVLVSIRSGDRPPTEMERLYGEQVEQRLFTVRGIRAIDQVARTGILIARVTFDWHSDMDLALVDVQWLRLFEISEESRAFLWTAGLIVVGDFFEEVEGWGADISYPGL